MSSTVCTILPSSLPSEGNVALLSPSSRITSLFPTRFVRACDFLKSLSLNPINFSPDNLSSASLATSISTRVSEVHSAFTDASISAIICVVGGTTANEILPYLDYDLIRQHPKPFIGYSDITLLHLAFYTKAGLRTFYGPAAIPSFGEFSRPYPFTVEHFLHVLRPSHPNKPVGLLPRSDGYTDTFRDWMLCEGPSGPLERPLRPAPGWNWLRPGKATGHLLGGCLPSLCQVQGTQYSPNWEGAVLFIELCEGEAGPGSPIPIEAAKMYLADLVMGGVLAAVEGLVMGRGYLHDEKMKEEWERYVKEICKMVWGDKEKPVLTGVDVGHTDPIVTLPIGAKCTVDSRKDLWEILEAGVK
ncbi:MAG: hypothetical protein Q9227_007165 [Pyrenula ochraceoflavens]